ncbi:hypothetical protein [uncultured Granulicatella sp.]|jgi:hypothetical protein|uniref:hypothetical protein n=1 Tax=uncultured Granulicatella sp. TaxID=316089 RepID=UPI00204FA574|nr:hypothetical protein [uncultured Granulicatella sp.]DAT02595.1 MAG TPA: hypothetical protein [Caudoviricetes sp.]
MIKQALEKLRLLEREHNFKSQGQVAPQVNCDLIEKSIDKKYQDLVDVILKELHHKKKCLQQGMFSTKTDIDEISGAIKQLETLVWYIESNQYEV